MADDDAPDTDLTIHVPGADAAVPVLPAAEIAAEQAAQALALSSVNRPPNAAERSGAAGARIAELEAENQQLRVMLGQLNAAVNGGAQGIANLDAALAAIPVAAVAPRAIVGEDWRNRTTEEARAAGVTKVVLCSDGYYCP